MSILLIDDQPESALQIVTAVKETLAGEVMSATSMQQGIELAEQAEMEIQFIICNYRGSSASLLKTLLTLRPSATFIFITDMLSTMESLLKRKGNTWVEVVNRNSMKTELPKALDRIARRSPSKLLKISDAEFVRMTIEVFRVVMPISADIFIRIGENKYVKIFKKEDKCDESELQKYLARMNDPSFYVKGTDAKTILNSQQEKLESMSKDKDLDEGNARKAIGSSTTLVRETIQKMGVTPEVRDLAKKTVGLTMRVMGNSPKLGLILGKMRENPAQYITSHSIVLAEVACALACKMDWQSSGTYLKLSLAAFLHDISLTDDVLAQIQTVDELEKRTDLTPAQKKQYKYHPVQASEYAKQFREIPPDVDQIIVEHHERPDGSGFPRGLFHSKVSPLSALFIIAHDILHFLQINQNVGMKEFIEARAEVYSQGSFKNIFKSIEADFLKKSKTS